MDSNLTRILFGEEPSYLALPSTPLQEARWTSESFGQTMDTTTSPEVSDNVDISDVILTGVAAQGDLGIAWSYGTYDVLLQGLLRGTWTPFVNVTANTISASAADNSFNDAAGTPTAFADLLPGDFIEFRGWAGTSINNNFFQVVSKPTAAKIIVLGSVVNASAGLPINIIGSQLRGGALERSFLIEKQYRGVTPHQFISFPGMRVANGSQTIPASGVITGSFGFQGTRAVPATATVGTGTPAEATSTEIMNSIDHVAHIREGGSLVTLEVSGLEWAIENNVRGRQAVGVRGRSSTRSGQRNVTGTIRVYFENPELYNKALAFEPSDMSYIVRGDGGAYAYYFPAFKFTGDPIPKASGPNTDLMVEAPFTGYRDPELGYAVQISRFPDVVPV